MSGNGTDHIGIMFGLGAAVLYATVVLLNKFIKNKLRSSVIVAFWQDESLA